MSEDEYLNTHSHSFSRLLSFLHDNFTKMQRTMAKDIEEYWWLQEIWVFECVISDSTVIFTRFVGNSCFHEMYYSDGSETLISTIYCYSRAIVGWNIRFRWFYLGVRYAMSQTFNSHEYHIHVVYRCKKQINSVTSLACNTKTLPYMGKATSYSL